MKCVWSRTSFTMLFSGTFILMFSIITGKVTIPIFFPIHFTYYMHESFKNIKEHIWIWNLNFTLQNRFKDFDCYNICFAGINSIVQVQYMSTIHFQFRHVLYCLPLIRSNALTCTVHIPQVRSDHFLSHTRTQNASQSLSWDHIFTRWRQFKLNLAAQFILQTQTYCIYVGTIHLECDISALKKIL